MALFGGVANIWKGVVSIAKSVVDYVSRSKPINENKINVIAESVNLTFSNGMTTTTHKTSSEPIFPQILSSKNVIFSSKSPPGVIGICPYQPAPNVSSSDGQINKPIVASAIPTVTVQREIGTLSAHYESGGRGPGTVSGGEGDYGGVSYGTYQLASSMKRPEAFLATDGQRWQAEFAGLKSGSPEFSKVWREVAAREPDALRKAEHAYIQRTHYQVTVDGVKARTSYDANAHSATLRDVVWSTSVQLGPDTKAVDKAISKVDKIMGRDDPRFERSLIEAIYAERGRKNDDGVLVYFTKSPTLKAGLENRFKSEGAEAVKRFDSEVKPF